MDGDGSEIHGFHTLQVGTTAVIFAADSEDRCHTAAAAEVAPAESGDYRRIMLSDVMVKKKDKVPLWERQWKSMGFGAVDVVLSMHLLSLLALFQFNWRAVSVAFGLYIVTSLLESKRQFEDLVADKDLFMSTLKKLNSELGTKFWIPKIRIVDMDLYKLFVHCDLGLSKRHLNQNSGRVILFHLKMLSNLRKDGHNWKRKKDGRTIRSSRTPESGW
ncbi:unnamed protein product [Microthlaspi erraticum]|uniref:CG-1 domain-containing protein n=1 Tax=Microthlaspi erraticum TaxID=1685480 RepID=A0A6D2HNI2_9BRAS|nr:unnamed protein product [Microthlaspi erraticum]